MMETIRANYSLHLFDGAAAGAAPGAEGGEAQAESKDLASPKAEPKVVYGKDDTENAEGNTGVATGDDNAANKEPDKASKFHELIKGEYAEEYNNLFKEQLNKRLKDHGEIKEKVSAYDKTVYPLYARYGIEPGDLAALEAAISEDNELFERAADEAGMTVDQYRDFLNVQNENQQLRSRISEVEEQEHLNKLYQALEKEVEETKEVYPNFDFQAEAERPPRVPGEDNDFIGMLRLPGMTVLEAYERARMDDLMPSVIQTTAEESKRAAIENIRARGMRPAENGAVQQQGIIRKSNVNDFTPADREKIAEKAAQGEVIKL